MNSGPNIIFGDVPKPKFESPDAEALWPVLIKQMKMLKTLAPSHQFLLEQACNQGADVKACRKAMKKYGRFESYYDKQGNELHRKSAACLALEDADRRWQRTLELLGLTPISQNKVEKVDPGTKEKGSEFFE